MNWLFRFDKKSFFTHVISIFAVVLFAVSFALVEAMVVIYLRQILASTVGDFFSNASQLSARASLFSLGYVVFLHPDVLANWDTLHLEIFREIATMIMLLTLSYLAGRNWREKISFYLLSFGVWDIFYYIWLHLFIGWPKSFLDIDVLFLIPVPWIGPVWLPIAISIGMIIVSLYLLGLKKISSK